MSDTPRTDAVLEEMYSPKYRLIVPASLAYELERENAALALVVRKMLLHYPTELNVITTEEELHAALDAARKEAQP